LTYIEGGLLIEKAFWKRSLKTISENNSLGSNFWKESLKKIFKKYS